MSRLSAGRKERKKKRACPQTTSVGAQATSVKSKFKMFIRSSDKTVNKCKLNNYVYFCLCLGPCYTSLGMEYGMISNSQMQASSEMQDNKKDWSRLNSLGWCVGGVETYYYLQIDLLTLTLVTGVVTQGKYEESPDQYAQAVTSFYLRYSLLGDKWLKYHTVCPCCYL